MKIKNLNLCEIIKFLKCKINTVLKILNVMNIEKMGKIQITS